MNSDSDRSLWLASRNERVASWRPHALRKFRGRQRTRPWPPANASAARPAGPGNRWPHFACGPIHVAAGPGWPDSSPVHRLSAGGYCSANAHPETRPPIAGFARSVTVLPPLHRCPARARRKSVQKSGGSIHWHAAITPDWIARLCAPFAGLTSISLGCAPVGRRCRRACSRLEQPPGLRPAVAHLRHIADLLLH